MARNRAQGLLIGVLIIGAILIGVALAFIFPLYRSVGTKAQILSERKSELLFSAVTVMGYVREPATNRTYLDLLSYVSSTGNITYCQRSFCINITGLLQQYFDNIFGDRWSLTISTPAALKGWLVDMYISTKVPDDYNVLNIQTPPDDPNGRKWYEYYYDPSKVEGWVKVVSPFHERSSIALSSGTWRLEELFGSSDYKSKFENCVPLSQLYKNVHPGWATVYCHDTRWPILSPRTGFSDVIWGSTTELPKNADLFYEGWQYRRKWGKPKLFSYKKDGGKYYISPPYYKTATDITMLAVEQGKIPGSCMENPNDENCIVVSFYRGKVKILPECKEVYLEVLWHEVLNLYLSTKDKTIWLAAEPCLTPKDIGIIPSEQREDIFCDDYCIPGERGDGIKCPIVYEGGINRHAWGYYRFNITEYVKPGEEIVLANVYGDPHIGSNGISVLRVFCINEEGEKIELNDIISVEKKKEITIGHEIPEGRDIYTMDIWFPVNHELVKVWYARLRIW